MDENTPLQFDLTLGEANQILTALGQMPFQAVNSLILKIQTQANAQIEQLNESKVPDSDPVATE